jgi:hypothetical protein
MIMENVVRPPLLKLILCIPGSSFSGRFLECLVDLIAFCFANNIQCLLSRKQSNNIYFVRNLCLGADVTRGPLQKPFDGKIDYDYLMWIDSDIIFRPEQIGQLINKNMDIASGLYLMEDGKSFAAVRDWDTEFFKANGYFKFLTPEDIKDAKEPVEVAYAGFGFMLIKKGVFETMTYPWFEPRKHEIGGMVDYSMEDVGFCLRAQEKGFKVFVDPQVRVGHEKKMIL